MCKINVVGDRFFATIFSIDVVADGGRFGAEEVNSKGQSGHV